MAVGTSTSYHSNAIPGVPQCGTDIDIHQVDLTPKFPVGYGFTRADGNKYRYSHFGENTLRGLVVSPDHGESSSRTPVIHIGAATVTDVPGEAVSPNAVGSHYIQVSITALAHQFAGAYAVVATGTGLGYTYRVKDNTVTGSPSAGEAYLELYEPLVTTILTDSGLVISGSPYSNLETADVTDERTPVGVTISNASSSNYAWICTYGLTAALQDTTGTASDGFMCYLSSNTAGNVMVNRVAANSTPVNFVTAPIIGKMYSAASAGNYATVYLELE